eukprot:696271-Amphidinium_carterae.1
MHAGLSPILKPPSHGDQRASPRWCPRLGVAGKHPPPDSPPSPASPPVFASLAAAITLGNAGSSDALSAAGFLLLWAGLARFKLPTSSSKPAQQLHTQ